LTGYFRFIRFLRTCESEWLDMMKMNSSVACSKVYSVIPAQAGIQEGQHE